MSLIRTCWWENFPVSINFPLESIRSTMSVFPFPFSGIVSLGGCGIFGRRFPVVEIASLKVSVYTLDCVTFRFVEFAGFFMWLFCEGWFGCEDEEFNGFPSSLVDSRTWILLLVRFGSVPSMAPWSCGILVNEWSPLCWLLDITGSSGRMFSRLSFFLLSIFSTLLSTPLNCFLRFWF